MKTASGGNGLGGRGLSGLRGKGALLIEQEQTIYTLALVASGLLRSKSSLVRLRAQEHDFAGATSDKALDMS
jgi:hypothetical protein